MTELCRYPTEVAHRRQPQIVATTDSDHRMPPKSVPAECGDVIQTVSRTDADGDGNRDEFPPYGGPLGAIRAPGPPSARSPHGPRHCHTPDLPWIHGCSWPGDRHRGRDAAGVLGGCGS